ncbi:unnamed protein product [Lactuca saligna]|uniref:F-box domain-containing protein n=1 Tax=Lactuca saligna TaxID=75948 RepID=A0AA35VXM6_LACSI|nr:unnamed protein product [Lactuca saligna]
MSDEIPFHIQELIIKRLPIVSLLQFRAVSKTWKSLINNSNFIAAHSITESQHLLIRYEDKESDTVGKYLSFVDDDIFPHQRFVHTLPRSIKLLKNANIVGSSFGIFCFHEFWSFKVEKSVFLIGVCGRRLGFRSSRPELTAGNSSWPVARVPELVARGSRSELAAQPRWFTAS